MKGGKQGRTRKSSSGGPRHETPKGKPKSGSAPRGSNLAPRKGSRKKPNVGGRSTSEEE